MPARINGFKQPFTLLVVYANANGAPRKDLFSNILAPTIRNLEDKDDIIMAGDFNFV